MLTVPGRGRMLLEGASREAEGYLELGMHPHALRSLQRRGKLVHSDSHACYLMGECLREMQRYSEAVYPLKRSVQLDPHPQASWLALGWCFKRTGRIDDAIHSLQQAIVFAPRDAMVHYNLACYYSLAARRMDALRSLKRALDLDTSLAGLVDEESDFELMRSDPALRMLLAATR